MEKRIESAQRSFLNGLSCCQAVIKPYCVHYGLDPEQMAKIASGFGGGMTVGKTCGALSGAIMVLGMALGFHDPGTSSEARQVYRSKVTELIRTFEAQHLHSECTALLGLDLSLPGGREKANAADLSATLCTQFIATAMTTVEAILSRSGIVIA